MVSASKRGTEVGQDGVRARAHFAALDGPERPLRSLPMKTFCATVMFLATLNSGRSG
jgi:hypothetical protein